MPTNNAPNSVVPFPEQHQKQPEKASPETAKAALNAIRKDLDGDSMAGVWNDKLTGTQKHGLWLVAGLAGADDGEYHGKWMRYPESYREKLRGVISTFAGLAVRIKGAVA